MTLRVFHVILTFVILGTMVPVFLHYKFNGFFSITQAALAFFLALNTLICLWEIALGKAFTPLLRCCFLFYCYGYSSVTINNLCLYSIYLYYSSSGVASYLNKMV